MIGIAMLIVMLVLLACGVPIAFCIGLASAVAILMVGPSAPWIIVPNSMMNGMDSFPLMAVPFFVLAGDLMNRGGITVRLVNFANLLVGGIRGGLAQANVMASMLFAGITGSALADTAAIGRILIPAMEREGYDRAYAAAVTASSSIIGPIIPPSITMVLFGVTAGVSIGGLFLAGVVPGVRRRRDGRPGRTGAAPSRPAARYPGTGSFPGSPRGRDRSASRGATERRRARDAGSRRRPACRAAGPAETRRRAPAAAGCVPRHSGSGRSATVDSPAASNTCASVQTVRGHRGQTGVRTTTSTPSSSSFCAHAGPVSRRNSDTVSGWLPANA